MYQIFVFGFAVLVLVREVELVHNFANVECGKINSNRLGKVVGGQAAKPNEFPWMVSITRRGGHFCGGTVLTNKHILTAGHCMCSGIGSNFLQPSSIKVTLGQHDLTQASTKAYEMSITEITIHPGYKCSKPRNDLAIIHLAEALDWSEFVSPACLPTSFEEDGYNRFDNVLATVAGWGWTNEQSNKGGRAKVLQKADVTVIETETCREWYKSQGKKTKIQDTQICAGREQGGVDSCWADSGGPLMVGSDSKDQMMVVGVVSTGIGCARPYLPGLYTRVSEYIPWIESIVFST